MQALHVQLLQAILARNAKLLWQGLRVVSLVPARGRPARPRVHAIARSTSTLCHSLHHMTRQKPSGAGTRYYIGVACAICMRIRYA